MTAVIRNGLPSPPDSEGSSSSVYDYCDNCDYYDNYVEIMYKHPEQFRFDLQQTLAERSGIQQLLDTIVIVPDAKDTIDDILSVLNELQLDGEGGLCIDGSYRFVMDSALHDSICSVLLHMLLNKIDERSLVLQHISPKLKINTDLTQAQFLAALVFDNINHQSKSQLFKQPDGGLSDTFLSLLSSLTGDSYYPPLVIENGVSQRSKDVLYASLLHASAWGFPVNTVLTTDIQTGFDDDEIHLSRFDLHHFDFSLENLKHIMQRLPENEDVENIRDRQSLSWIIHTKLSRSIAYAGSLCILLRETIALNSIVDQPDTPEEIQAQEVIVDRIDEMFSSLDLKWEARAFIDEMVAHWQDLDEQVHLLGDTTTVISRLDQARQLFEADLENFPISQNINSETATQRVIRLVVDTHQTYDLCDPANLLQGFRIPVSSILSIPTGQKWIDVTVTDLKKLFKAARIFVRRLEGSVVNMRVPKDGVKQHYQRNFLRMVRRQSNASDAQTFDDLFASYDTIDTNTCVKFVSTKKIVSYLRDQGVQLNESAKRDTAVSRLLGIYSEREEIDFVLNSSTLGYFHGHRRTEVALNILHRLGRRWGRDPWKSLQDFVHRQGEKILRLPLKYFSNGGLIELHHMHGLGECFSQRREDLVRALVSRAASLNPDTQDGEDEPMEDLQWIEDVIAVLPPGSLDPERVVEVLKGATDPEQQHSLANAANTNPISFAMILAVSTNVEQLLNGLNLE